MVPFFSLLLDLWIGDPENMPHPVVLMGKAVTFWENRLRAGFAKNETGERTAGRILAICLPLFTFILTGGVYVLLFSAGRLADIFFRVLLLLDVFWGFQAVAVKDMLKESRAVYRALPKDHNPEDGEELEAARAAVSRIVGRDTASLSSEGVIKAAVESIAESFSDGMFAPMLCLSLGGAPLALCYKAVNTMDSMIGYRNARYLHFGRAAAKLDDAMNFLPSRLAALLLVLAAFMAGRREPSVSGRRAFLIWRRDRRNHASPNSAQTEAAMAGALGVQLGGGAWYFGEYYDKPTIGDAERPVRRDDILTANRLFLTASVCGTLLACLIRGILIFGVKG
ncbi:MAG: adenosylcobinamide-phosphate synthase CbiB [Lachnospiraceae bacterium]|nr:adenosylcobinamide-phosphate synthase CbiB [Lachnospiraceae bacterium]